MAEQRTQSTALPMRRHDLVIVGKVLTLDALLTQRQVAQRIRARGGDYLIVVKDNQPRLRAAIQAVCTEKQWLAATMTSSATLDRGQGRIEARRLPPATALAEASHWPGVEPVCAIERVVTKKNSGEQRQEIVYGIRSLTAQRAAAARWWEVSRQHWQIEHKRHWVREVNL